MVFTCVTELEGVDGKIGSGERVLLRLQTVCYAILSYQARSLKLCIMFTESFTSAYLAKHVALLASKTNLACDM